MVNKNGVWLQVGVTSSGDESDGLYARIASRCDWIKEVTGGEVECVVADD